VSPDELAEVVEAFATHSALIEDTIDAPPEARTPYEVKNVLNQMTPEYAKLQRRRYLKDTAQIRAFLAAPENQHILKAYETAVDEFELKIMNYLVDLLFDRDPVLRQHKRLTRAVVFYMYWNCDIGLGADDVTA
jgi:hypothetical protein